MKTLIKAQVILSLSHAFFGVFIYLTPNLSAHMDVKYLKFGERHLAVSLLYNPNPNNQTERKIAEATNEFVKSTYTERGTAPTGSYDFTGYRTLITVSEAQEIIGSIELVYIKDPESLPMLDRHRRWMDINPLLETLKNQQNIVEIKKFAVKRHAENRRLGLLLSFLAYEFGMHSNKLGVSAHRSFTPLSLVVAETKPGAHVRVYQALGMREIFKVDHDPDFTDGRGLSIVAGTPDTIKESIFLALKRLYPREHCSDFFATL